MITIQESDLSRIVEMAWEDRTPFEAIEAQFKLSILPDSIQIKVSLRAYGFAFLGLRVCKRF